MQPNRPYKKCARIVGDVMGSYHPHGDTAIYDTLVRLAQPFSMRYPLVDGQGNFGNVDGYQAAAMRYTECRLTRLATELLRDIDADTVDFQPNYDESRREPTVLPARFPNLLVNGSSGIAVGMATNIPPHHLGETIDALVALIDEPSIDVERLMKHVKGPDFPTAGIIVGREGIREAYRSGRGRIVVRARAHVEELRGGRTAIVVNELPYTVKKGGDEGVIKKIADLVKDGILPEVADLKDLSDRIGHAHRGAPEARRRAAGRAQQAVQAHVAADDVRLQRRRARRRRAAHARAARPALPLPRAPARRRHAPAQVRAAPGGGPRARPAGLPDRARQPRRGHRAHPGRGRHRRGPDGADGALRAARRSRPRRSSTSACARSPGSSASASRTSSPTCRSGSPSCGRSSATSRASMPSSARSCSRSSRSTAATTTGAPRSSPRRTSSSSRT